MSVPSAQLSCSQCQQRKKKCSKTVPCSQCVKSGYACTPVRRARLPRGRSGKKRSDVDDHALKERISRLEAIVARLGPSAGQNNPPTPAKSVDTRDGKAVRAEMLVAQDFWDELSNAVAGLKDVLHGDAGDDSAMATASVGPQGMQQSWLPFGSDTASSTSSRHFWPPIELKNRLLDVYRHRVDPVFKVLHWPSTREYIIARWQSYVEESTPQQDPLESAIYFTAICSLQSHEIEDWSILMEQSRHDAELSFMCTDLLTTTSFPVLQAFVIYLAGLRACQANAQQWTLLPTAIRLASAQGFPARLQYHAASRMSNELYRRLWSCIGVLDLQSAFDRGTAPLLRSGELHAQPANLDDEACSQDAAAPELAGERFTDMTFSCLIDHAGISQRRIVEIDFDTSLDPSAATSAQAKVLRNFEDRARLLLEPCSASPTIFQQFTMVVAEECIIAMKLLLHRPLHKRDQARSQAVEPIDILATATEVLQKSQTKRGFHEFMPWAWFSFIKWYALAIVLVELCTAHGDFADFAWTVAQVAYDDYAEVVADTKRGLLWKPIERLMNKVKIVRAQVEESKLGKDLLDDSWLHWDLLTQDIYTSFMDEP